MVTFKKGFSLRTFVKVCLLCVSLAIASSRHSTIQRSNTGLIQDFFAPGLFFRYIFYIYQMIRSNILVYNDMGLLHLIKKFKWVTTTIHYLVYLNKLKEIIILISKKNLFSDILRIKLNYLKN